jgi:hypothetical protein
MIEIRFDKTKDEVALLIWLLVDHSVHNAYERVFIGRVHVQIFRGVLSPAAYRSIYQT